MVNLMANVKTDEKLYERLRATGLRKKVARQLSELPSQVSDGKQAPKPLRDAVDRLEAITKELKGHTRSGDRKAAATNLGAAGRSGSVVTHARPYPASRP